MYCIVQTFYWNFYYVSVIKAEDFDQPISLSIAMKNISKLRNVWQTA